MMFWRKCIVLFACCSLFGFEASAQTRVSASIYPLQLIAGAITDGVSEPILILGADQNPHQVSLRPSNRRALSQAELLLWLGSTMEGSIDKVIDELDAVIITALELEGLQKQILRNGVDPHLWLNTENARLIAKALMEELIRLDEKNSEHYENNLSEFLLGLDELDGEIQNKMNQQGNKTFAVYHNAFQYFEQQFGLQHVVSFTDDEELQPGIRTLLKIRKALQENQVNCLLVEPEININELSNKIDNTAMRYVSIDVLGLNFPVEKNAYRQFMSALTDAVITCLR